VAHGVVGAADPHPSPGDRLERAKRFYAEQLGLVPEAELPDGAFYRCGAGTRFLLFPSEPLSSEGNLLALGQFD